MTWLLWIGLGLFVGFFGTSVVFGDAMARYIRLGQMTWAKKTYRITPIGAANDRPSDPVSVVKAAMNNGEFDSEIARINNRNLNRQKA